MGKSNRTVKDGWDVEWIDNEDGAEVIVHAMPEKEFALFEEFCDIHQIGKNEALEYMMSCGLCFLEIEDAMEKIRTALAEFILNLP